MRIVIEWPLDEPHPTAVRLVYSGERRRLRKIRNDTICRKYREGLLLRNIAEDVGISYGSVVTILAKLISPEERRGRGNPYGGRKNTT